MKYYISTHAMYTIFIKLIKKYGISIVTYIAFVKFMIKGVIDKKIVYIIWEKNLSYVDKFI